MVGDVLLAQGKLQDALDIYRQSLAIAERLAEQDASNSNWQLGFSIIYEGLVQSCWRKASFRMRWISIRKA